MLLPGVAAAHDSWINKGAYRSPAGEWCCGANDCAVMDEDAVTEAPDGLRFDGIGRIGEGAGQISERYKETVPYSEVMPLAKDGRYWRCKRPDGTRRCVFGPPGST